jgi:hypothetical protein
MTAGGVGSVILRERVFALKHVRIVEKQGSTLKLGLVKLVWSLRKIKQVIL